MGTYSKECVYLEAGPLGADHLGQVADMHSWQRPDLSIHQETLRTTPSCVRSVGTRSKGGKRAMIRGTYIVPPSYSPFRIGLIIHCYVLSVPY
jgi:hypothetical protein